MGKGKKKSIMEAKLKKEREKGGAMSAKKTNQKEFKKKNEGWAKKKQVVGVF